MTDDVQTPKELEIVHSYLSDVDEQIEERIKSEPESIGRRIAAAQVIQRGDLALAHRELDKLQAQGFDSDAIAATRSALFFKEGNLTWAVATSGGPNTGDQARWLKKTVEAFEKSIQLGPTAGAYYNLGLALKLLDRKSSAVEAFRKVEALGDPQLNMEAQKEIARLDPNGRIPSATPASGAGHAVAGRSKKPHWGSLVGASLRSSSPGFTPFSSS